MLSPLISVQLKSFINRVVAVLNIIIQYSLSIFKLDMRASCAGMLAWHARCSFFKDMNFQGSLTRAGHRASKFETRTEGSLMPAICLEGVCVIIQINVLIIVCPYVSRVQLGIPPVLVPVIIKRNREHDSKGLVDVWNVIGQDSDNSFCNWSSRLARSIKYGIRFRK